jgi:hypothetical protein
MRFSLARQTPKRDQVLVRKGPAHLDEPVDVGRASAKRELGGVGDDLQLVIRQYKYEFVKSERDPTCSWLVINEHLLDSGLHAQITAVRR